MAAARPCRLLILGEGPMRPELEGRLRALGLEALRAKAARFPLERAVAGYEEVVGRVLRGPGVR